MLSHCIFISGFILYHKGGKYVKINNKLIDKRGVFLKIRMEKRKRIALIAHDNKKDDLLNWVKENKEILKNHDLCGTGTTSKVLAENAGLEIFAFKSGPLGGDQQIGAQIVEGNVDMMIFFWDPLEAQPHDPDVKALLRIAVLYDVLTAHNVSTADYILSSHLMNETYDRNVVDHVGNRNIKF